MLDNIDIITESTKKIDITKNEFIIIVRITFIKYNIKNTYLFTNPLIHSLILDTLTSNSSPDIFSSLINLLQLIHSDSLLTQIGQHHIVEVVLKMEKS